MARDALRPSPGRAWPIALLAFLFAWLALFVPHARTAHAHPNDADSAVDAPSLRDSRLNLPALPRGFDVQEFDWLHLAYPAALSHWVTPLVEEANQFRALARQRFGSDVLSRVYIRLASDTREMATLAPENAPYPKYAVGVAYSKAGLILLSQEPLHPNSEHDLRAVLRHELAHVALHDAVDGRRVPLWFNEGLAIYLARENTFGRMRALWTATVSGNLINLGDLDRRFPRDVVGVPLAYAQSADVVRYLLRQQDAERFDLLIQRVARGQSFEKALSDAYGLDFYNLERSWREDVEGRYSLWPVLLSGTLIWGGATVLIFVAWRRKHLKQQKTLARWAREEAAEDVARARTQLLLTAREPENHASPGNLTPVGPPPEANIQIIPREPLVPKVQHDGNWHTLH